MKEGAESYLLAEKTRFWASIADCPCAIDVIKCTEAHLVCQSNGQSKTYFRHQDTAFCACFWRSAGQG